MLDTTKKGYTKDCDTVEYISGNSSTLRTLII